MKRCQQQDLLTMASFTPTEWMRALAREYPERFKSILLPDEGRVTGKLDASDGVLTVKVYAS